MEPRANFKYDLALKYVVRVLILERDMLHIAQTESATKTIWAYTHWTAVSEGRQRDQSDR
jgi:hypothetical protein